MIRSRGITAVVASAMGMSNDTVQNANNLLGNIADSSESTDSPAYPWLRKVRSAGSAVILFLPVKERLITRVEMADQR